MALEGVRMIPDVDLVARVENHLAEYGMLSSAVVRQHVESMRRFAEAADKTGASLSAFLGRDRIVD